MMFDDTGTLFDAMIREMGYEPYTAGGFVSFLAVGVHNGAFARATARRAEYMRGLPEDFNADVLPVMIWSEVQRLPLGQGDDALGVPL